MVGLLMREKDDSNPIAIPTGQLSIRISMNKIIRQNKLCRHFFVDKPFSAF